MMVRVLATGEKLFSFGRIACFGWLSIVENPQHKKIVSLHLLNATYNYLAL